MRQRGRIQPVVAGVLALLMVVSITGLLGAASTSVKLAGLKSGARVSGVINLQATVSTSEASYVILGIDQDRPQSSNSPPYSFELDTRELTDGAHKIFVEAYDRYGLMGSSSVITIYVKNGAGSAVQAKRPAATQLASKPKPASAPKVAKGSTTPPVRVASQGKIAKVQVATAPAAADASPATAPMMSGRGPIPAPTRAAADTQVAAVRTGSGVVSSGRATSSGLIGSLPPTPQLASKVVRGHTVVLNGQAVQFDVSPRIEHGRMQVAFRAMFESEGGRVTWNAENKTATSMRGALTVEVPVGQRIAKVNGVPMDMGVRASIHKGRTMIPVRFYADATGSGLSWDNQTRTAMLQNGDKRIAVAAP